MIELIYPNKNFKEYINYISNYCKENNLTLILKGSLACGSACEYSDIDILICGNINSKNIYEIVYNYDIPILINISTNPKDMLIITYENKISVDLDIRKTLIEDDIVNNLILVKNDFKINNLIIRHDVKIAIINEKYSFEILEILKLIIKGTNKYLAKNKSIANEFLEEIKEKCMKYFEFNNLDFTNEYKYDIILIYHNILSLYEIDTFTKKYIDKLLLELK